MKTEGSAFDLPMAIPILGSYGLLPKSDLSDYLMIGELSLDGFINGSRPIEPLRPDCRISSEGAHKRASHTKRLKHRKVYNA